MNPQADPSAPGAASSPSSSGPPGPVVKIIGVGNAGIAMLGMLNHTEFSSAAMVVINTEAGALTSSSAPVKIHLENKLLRGLGSGGDPDRGRAVAEEQFSTLKAACEGANIVFIVTGLGGGAGSGISPVLARAAHEAGALVLAFVTLPFHCEGNRRESQAQKSLEQLKKLADGVICLPSQRIFKIIEENTGARETFRVIDGFLVQAVHGVWQLLTCPGLIQVHFGDLCDLLRDRHAESLFAFAEATGPGRAREVVETILAHPLLDDGRALAESTAVLVSLVAGQDLSMAEINRVMEQIKRQCGRAKILMGAALDPALENTLCVTLIAARQESRTEPAAADAVPAASSSSAAPAPTSVKPRFEMSEEIPLAGGPREVPPAPVSRPRKGIPGNKPVQTQLPLTIVSKGRFDKSEPTKHNGEDLDIPTFIRRGIVMN
jgi:cell division protein FtsZ